MHTKGNTNQTIEWCVKSEVWERGRHAVITTAISVIKSTIYCVGRLKGTENNNVHQRITNKAELMPSVRYYRGGSYDIIMYNSLENNMILLALVRHSCASQSLICRAKFSEEFWALKEAIKLSTNLSSKHQSGALRFVLYDFV